MAAPMLKITDILSYWTFLFMTADLTHDSGHRNASLQNVFLTGGSAVAMNSFRLQNLLKRFPAF
jgi:hypothetical protein